MRPVLRKAPTNLFHNLKDAVETNLSLSQFAYPEGGNCTSALLAIEYFINKNILTVKQCVFLQWTLVKHLNRLGTNYYLSN